ncbi:hypothetical protein NW762_009261 [Fusarium torreyae]|uniref:Extracellular membrane protein CFEM domain-containing protein n=1 Tax=Fusarium torreyae TaxID=1237075 RepID=A0A9W8RWT2_9HYPO|nr:hypothetical protein NW762_009261 [Fusarium torreyae]
MPRVLEGDLAYGRLQWLIYALLQNGCFFGSFPGGSCTDDAACMCTQQKYREKYFCCMAEKCDSDIMPESIERQHSECRARDLDFTFDAEKVCGINLTTTTTPASSATVAATTSSVSHESSATSTTALVTSDAETTTTAESTPEASSTGSAAPVADSAPQVKFALSGIAMLFVVSGMLLL